MDNMRDLLTNGFMIFPSQGKFLVKKESVPGNTLIIKEQEFDSYELAVEAAVEMLKKPQLIEWNVIVRYNRGLGIEYKNLPAVVASDKNKAKILAELNAAEVFDPAVNIGEIKVTPKK